MDTQKPTRRLNINAPDPLKHFSRDGPWFRLAALLICKLSSIIFAAVVAYFFGKARGWW
jgi:hypothetical protein